MYLHNGAELIRLNKGYGGTGIINWMINRVPFELHVPTYRYLGPGTRLEEKLKTNTPGINPLDEAAKEHDIAYQLHSNLNDRHKADEILENKAWERVKSQNASIGERASAWLTTNVMKVKRRLGAGICQRYKKRDKKFTFKNKNSAKKRVGSGITFNQLVKKAKKSVKSKKSKSNNLESAVQQTLSAIKKYKVKNPPGRVLPIPKSGGAIPLIPILSALNHIGTLIGGVGAIVEGVKQIKSVRDQYKNRSSSTPETHIGQGIVFGPHKKGFGIFIKK